MGVKVAGREDEKELVAAVTDVNDLVSEGLSPNEAVEKVATARNLPPGKVFVIGHAFNTGRQLNQWRDNRSTSILDKLASFDLCDPATVVSNMEANKKEKSAEEAVDPCYSRGPVAPSKIKPAREKTAEAKQVIQASSLPTQKPRLDAVIAEINSEKQAYEKKQMYARELREKLASNLSDAISYFRKPVIDRLPMPSVERTSLAFIGKAASVVFDTVQSQIGSKEKRATDYKPNAKVTEVPFEPDRMPFVAVRSAVQLAEKIASVDTELEDMRVNLCNAIVTKLEPFRGQADPEKFAEFALCSFAKEAAMRPKLKMPGDAYGDVTSLESELDELKHQTSQAELLLGVKRRPKPKKLPEKTAALGFGMGAMLGSGFAKSLLGKTKQEMVDNTWLSLEDPEHENALRAIRARAMLSQLMSDPSEPISAYSPNQIYQVYNEISQATPRVADTLATLRPALRRRLEGHTEPFEAKELLDLEQGLAKSKATSGPELMSLVPGAAPR
jgi:hypothetical protein